MQQPNVREAVDETIAKLGAAKFVPDPIIAPGIGRIASIIGSVQKRHGAILKQAVYAAVSRKPGLTVWADDAFIVHPDADAACDPRKPREQWSDVSIPYSDVGRTIRVDMLVLDGKELRAYSIKRGNGQHDAGKMRQVVRDLICTQIMLRSYAAARGHRGVRKTSAHLISYYGQEQQAGDWTLDRTQLDQHFGFPVTAQIEAINEYYRSEVAAICAKTLRQARMR